jgi:hypothetical protein
VIQKVDDHSLFDDLAMAFRNQSVESNRYRFAFNNKIAYRINIVPGSIPFSFPLPLIHELEVIIINDGKSMGSNCVFTSKLYQHGFFHKGEIKTSTLINDGRIRERSAP